MFNTLRKWLASETPKKKPTKRLLNLEQFEDRLTPSITVTTLTNTLTAPWIEQGGGPSINSQSGVANANKPVNGAINSVLVNPQNPNIAFAGTVAGGVWRTTNFQSAPDTIIWQPINDRAVTLYTDGMSFDSSDRTYSTILVGTGSVSSTFRSYPTGNFKGIYRITNANAPNIANVSMTLLNSPNITASTNAVASAKSNPNIIIAGGGPNGIDFQGSAFLVRSTNGGSTFSSILGTGGLPNSPDSVTDVVSDPNRPQTFYVALTATGNTINDGIYRSDDGGLNWARIDAGNVTRPISHPAFSAAYQGEERVRLSIMNNNGLDVIYAGFEGVDVNGSATLESIWRYEESGIDTNFNGIVGDPPETAWFKVGIPPQVNPSGQGTVHFSLVADARDKNTVYIGGDSNRTAQFGTFGNLARGTYTGANGFSAPTLDTGNWTALTPGNSDTHADSRDMYLIAPADPTQPETLVETDDGGISRLVNPISPSGTGTQVWLSVGNNIRNFEYYEVAYDSRANLIFAPAQDNNPQIQTSPGSSIFTPINDGTNFAKGDGFSVEYSIPGDTRYYNANSLGTFTRQVAGGTLTSLRLANAPGGAFYSGLENTSGGNTDMQAVNSVVGTLPMAANRYLGGGLLFGRRALYESNDRGDSLNILIQPTGINNEKVPFDQFSAVVYGGQRNQVSLTNIFYAGTQAGLLYLGDVSNTGGRQIFDRTAALNAAIPGAFQIDDIVSDAADYRRVYVLKNNHIARSIDGGATWTDITGNLGTLTNGDITSIAIVDTTLNNAADGGLLVAGGYGGTFSLRLQNLPTTTWTTFGVGLPNVLISALRFVPGADPDGNAANGTGVLVASTFGRGTFLVTNADQYALNKINITVTGDNNANTLKLYKSQTTVDQVTVEDGLGNVQTFDRNSIASITFNGLGGNDTLLINSNPAGGGTLDFFNFPVTFNGGGQAGDNLILNDTASTANLRTTVSNNAINVGTGDNLFLPGGSVTYSGVAKVSVLGGSGSNTLLGGNAAANTITVVDGNSGTANGSLTFSNFTNFGGTTGFNTVNFVSNATSSQNLSLQLTGAFSDKLTGYGTVTDTLSGIQSVGVQGGSGINNLNVINATGTSYGTALNPGTGIDYAPTSSTSGIFFTMANPLSTIAASNITGSLAYYGGAARDVVQFLAPSTAGAAGAGSNGEAVVANGANQLTVSDSGVSGSNASLGTLLGLNIGTSNGIPTAKTIYVRTGFKSGTADSVVATTSTTTNIVVDGTGGPTSKPGNSLQINAVGATTTAKTTDPTFGPPQTRVTGSDGGSLGYINFKTVGGTTSSSTSIIVTAAGPGGPPLVQVYDAVTHALKAQFLAYDAAFTGGVHVAVGDVNGDGVPDIITGTGAGAAPHVKVFDGVTFQEIFSFYAYDPRVTSGVNVAAGDVNGDGFADIITGPAFGMPSHVRAFSGKDGSELKSFYAYDPANLTGVSVAAADFNGDGRDDIVTGAGPGGGPHVKVFDSSTGQEIRSFYAFDPNNASGVNVAVAPVNGGVPEIIAAPAQTSTPFVFIIDGTTTQPITAFFVNQSFAPDSISSTPVQVGVQVATTVVNGIPELVVAKGGVGQRPQIFVYTINPLTPVFDFLAFDGTFSGGVNVGAA